jgi:hypothetical protein
VLIGAFDAVAYKHHCRHFLPQIFLAGSRGSPHTHRRLANVIDNSACRYHCGAGAQAADIISRTRAGPRSLERTRSK